MFPRIIVFGMKSTGNRLRLMIAKHEATQLSPDFVNFGMVMVLSGMDDSSQSLEKDLNCEKHGFESDTRNEAFKKMFTDIKLRLEIAG